MTYEDLEGERDYLYSKAKLYQSQMDKSNNRVIELEKALMCVEILAGEAECDQASAFGWDLKLLPAYSKYSQICTVSHLALGTCKACMNRKEELICRDIELAMELVESTYRKDVENG